MSKHQLRRVAAKVLADPLPYTSYDIGKTELLFATDEPLSEFESQIRDSGYHYQLLAAVKRLGDRTDVGSYARIPTEHPHEAKGTRLAELDPRECQYHIHPFIVDDEIRVYGHYEIHPYPHTPTWDLTRPYPRHYRPTYDSGRNPRSEWTYLRGVCDPKLEAQFK